MKDINSRMSVSEIKDDDVGSLCGAEQDQGRTKHKWTKHKCGTGGWVDDNSDETRESRRK